MPRRSAFTDQQIVAALREVEMGETPRSEVCRRMGVTDTTFARWKKKFGAMHVAEMRRLRELETETSRLTKLLTTRCARFVSGSSSPHFFSRKTGVMTRTTSSSPTSLHQSMSSKGR